MAKWPGDKDKNNDQWSYAREEEECKLDDSYSYGKNKKQFYYEMTAPPEPPKKTIFKGPPQVIRELNNIVSIKVVDDATNAPVMNVKLDVSLNNHDTATIKTDNRGNARGEKVSRNCRVACRYADRTVNEFYEIIGEGEERIGSEPKNANVPDNSEHPSEHAIVGSVIKHQVADGETLASIARKYGRDFSLLARFNWGIVFRDEIDSYLEDNFGCNKKIGGQYILKGARAPKDPWIIYIPKVVNDYRGYTTWEKEIVCTEKGPTSPITIRVRKVGLPQAGINYTFPIRLEIDPNDAKNKDDVFILFSQCGEYKQELTIKDDLVSGDCFVDLEFKKLIPGLTYSLVVKNKQEMYTFFDGYLFDDIAVKA